ncbi:MAG: SH3 domain-containing protein [Anaerolineae bacterium]
MKHALTTLIFAVCMFVVPLGLQVASAQEGPTATPQPVNLSTVAPQSVPGAGATPTRTPTPEGQIYIEAREFANVRAQPDPDAAQLGQIRSGERFVALGRYFQWIQFQYPPSPTGIGWVFGDLVNVIGDSALIPELADPAANAPNEAEIMAASTAAAVTQTPGGVLTATAATRFEALGQATLEGPVILPTFTYPPGITFQTTSVPEAEATPAPAATDQTGGSVPPIVPILAVGGLGVLGLLISSLRRKR